MTSLPIASGCAALRSLTVLEADADAMVARRILKGLDANVLLECGTLSEALKPLCLLLWILHINRTEAQNGFPCIMGNMEDAASAPECSGNIGCRDSRRRLRTISLSGRAVDQS